jgi:hypothetical protein
MAILRTVGALPIEQTRRVENTSALFLLLIGSVVFSIVTGFVTAKFSAGPSYWPVLVVCATLLAMGIFFQMQSWKLMPIWYHLPFLLLLVPATLFGAWLRLK